MERLQIEGLPERMIDWLNNTNDEKDPNGEKVWQRFFWLMACNGGPIVRETHEDASAVGPFNDGLDVGESIELAQMTAFCNGIMWSLAQDVWDLIEAAVKEYFTDEKERHERSEKD